MSSFAYYNGVYRKKEEIYIPLSDRSIFFGDAIYDAAIGSCDRILWEDEHINRFLLNSNKMGIRHNFTKEYLSSLLREIGVKSMLKSYFIYFQMSRALPNRNHSFSGAEARLLVTVDPIKIDKKPAPLNLITTTDKRYGYCDIKTTNLIPSVIASTKADRTGCDEAIFVRGRYVTECTKSNIAIIKQGRVITHPATNRILPGITREHLKINCNLLNIPFVERRFSVSEMLSADEILVTSTTKLCKTVCKINGKTVGGKNPILANSIAKIFISEYEKCCKL